MLLVHFLMVLGSGMAMRPENSQGAEVMHSAVVQGTPHRIVASLLNQTTRADPRLALVGQSLAQMLDGNPNPEGEFNSLTDSLRDVLNKLLDEAKAAAGLAQANAQKEADSFEDCHSMDPHFQNFDDELQEHVQCRQAASALKTTADACNSEKAALKGTMEIACQAYDDYKAADHSCPARYSGESIEEWLLKAKNQFATRYDDYLDKKKACDDATADHDVVDCTSKNSAYEAKEGECDALYITLETHSCDHATVASQLADQYETCYEDKKNEYLEREAEMELETQRKLNSRLSMRILCLLDSVQEDADSKAFTIKEDAFEVCADKPEYDTDHLEVDWPPLPDESPPVVPSAYPCNTAYDEKVRAKLPTFADVPVCTECPGVSKAEPLMFADNVMHYLSFDDGSWSDDTGSSTVSTASSRCATSDFVEGIRPGSLAFHFKDGCRIRLDSPTRLVKEWSMSMWFKPDSTFDSRSGREDWLYGSDHSWSCYTCFHLTMNRGGVNNLRFYHSSPTLEAPYQTFEKGTWYSLVVTQTSEAQAFYVDGEKVGEVQRAAVEAAGKGPMRVGPQNGQVGMAIDELLFYDRGFDAGEVQRILTQQRTGKGSLKLA